MWRKKLRIRKVQSFMIFLIALVCALLISSAMGILLSLNKPINDLKEECKSPLIKIVAYDNSEKSVLELRDNLLKIDEVRNIEITSRHILQEKVICNNKTIENFLNLVEFNENFHENNIRFISDKVKNLKDDECLIPQIVSNENDIKIGDKINVIKGEKEYIYKVKGTYSDPYSLNTAFSLDIIIKNIPQEFEKNNLLIIYGKENVKSSDILDKYRESNNGILKGYVVTLEDCISNSILTERIMGGILLGIGVLILIVSCMMIRFMIKNALINDNKTIAVYKVIGYSSKDILFMYMKLYLFITSIATLIGIVLSTIIVNVFLKETYSNIGASKDNGILIPGIISFILILTSVAFSVYRVLSITKKIKPATILKGDDYEAKKIKGNILFEGLGFSSFGIAVRNIFRDKKNTAFIILTCIFSIYIVNFGVQSINRVKNMREDNYYWFGFDKGDLVLQSSINEEYENMYKVLEEDKRTLKLVKTGAESISLVWQKGIKQPDIDAKVYDTYEELDMRVLKGRNPKYSNEIALSTVIAEETGKEVGDYIDIYINRDYKTSLLVCGIYQSYYDLGKECRLLKETFDKSDREFQYDEISIYLKDISDLQEYKDDYNKKLNGKGKIIFRTEKYETIMNKICAPQEKAIAPFITMVLVLGAINIFAIITLKNAKNNKSNSIYKSLGYGSFHLIKANIYYVLIIALTSLIITLPLFMLTYSKIMTVCLCVFGVKEYPVDFRALDIIKCNGIVLIMFIVSTLLSSNKIYKTNINVLNEE